MQIEKKNTTFFCNARPGRTAADSEFILFIEFPAFEFIYIHTNIYLQSFRTTTICSLILYLEKKKMLRPFPCIYTRIYGAGVYKIDKFFFHLIFYSTQVYNVYMLQYYIRQGSIQVHNIEQYYFIKAWL